MYYVPKNNKLEENGLRYGMFYSSYIYKIAVSSYLSILSSCIKYQK